MDCDDQVRLVKRNYHTHADSPNVSGIPQLAGPILIDLNGMSDYRFGVHDSPAELPRIVFGMSREAHALSSFQRPKLSPLG